MNYKNRLLWATDLTTQTASIGSCFKSECVLDLIYRKFQSSFNLSYSFKSQSKEEIQDTRDCFIRTNNAYANSMQTFVQTPNPVTQNSWTTNLITPDANLTNIPEKAISFFQNNTLYGTPVKPGYIMTENDIDYDSGLMNTQILNIISGGYNYESIYETFVTNFGIKGGVGISPTTAYTPEFWELVASMEINY